jgi:hypothetical protein
MVEVLFYEKKKAYEKRTMPRRSRSRSRVRIPLRKIPFLSRCGYQARSPASARHAALTCAVQQHGELSVYRKLNVLMVLNKNRSPRLSSRFRTDRNWVKREYMKDR